MMDELLRKDEKDNVSRRLREAQRINEGKMRRY